MTGWGSWSNPCLITQNSSSNYRKWRLEVESSSIVACPIQKGEYKILNFILGSVSEYPDGEYRLTVALIREEETICSGFLYFYIK